MFKPYKAAFGPQQILLVLVVIGIVFLLYKWTNSRDKNKIKADILASAPHKRCISCDAENENEAKFCKQCGSQDFK